MQKEKKTGKKKKIIIISSVIIVVLIAVFTVYYFYPKTSSVSSGTGTKNPVANLSDEQAVQLFDESFVRYLLYSIEANKLHNPPLGSETPKIEIQLGDETYNAEVIKKVVHVKKGQIENEDIIITTTKEEAVKMLRNRNYIADSFRSGSTSIELIASQTALFAKGYLQIYNQFSTEE